MESDALASFEGKAATMRDLRSDLRERLTELDAQTGALAHEYNERINEVKAWHEAQVKLVEEERKAVSGLLSIEMRKHGEQPAIRAPHLPLADFLIQEAAKRGISSKEDLRLAAVQASYFSNGEGGGRQVHTTLLNLVKANKIKELSEGRYGAYTQRERDFIEDIMSAQEAE